MKRLLAIGVIALVLSFLPSGVSAQLYTQLDIQAKITEVGQGDVKLNAVTYYISAPVVIPSGINLIGQGNSTELRATTNTRVIVSVVGASDLSISRLRVNGDKQDIDILVLFNQNQNVDVERVTIENAKHTGMFLQEVTCSSVSKSLFRNNGEIGGDSALFFSGGKFNEASRNRGYNNQNGITGLDLEYSTIDRNKFNNSKLDAYNFTSRETSPRSVGILVTHNIGYNSDRNTSGGVGIYFNLLDYSEASYNILEGFGAHGIALDGSSFNDISHNTVRNIGWSGIVFYASNKDMSIGSTNNRVADNFIEGASQTQVSQAAIDIVNEFCDYNTIGENTVRLGNSLNQRYAIFVQSGRETIVADNDLRNGYLIEPIIDHGVGTILRDNRG